MKGEIELMVSRLNGSAEAKRILEQNIFDQKVVIGTTGGESFTVEIAHLSPVLKVKKGRVPFKMFKTAEIRMDKGLLISILKGEESYSKNFVDGKIRAKGLLSILMLVARLFRINGDIARAK